MIPKIPHSGSIDLMVLNFERLCITIVWLFGYCSGKTKILTLQNFGEALINREYPPGVFFGQKIS